MIESNYPSLVECFLDRSILIYFAIFELSDMVLVAVLLKVIMTTLAGCWLSPSSSRHFHEMHFRILYLKHFQIVLNGQVWSSDSNIHLFILKQVVYLVK